jgi:hypothetical protein
MFGFSKREMSKDLNRLTQILTMYGEEFSKVPNPASYEFLIRTWDSQHSNLFPN